MFKKDTKIPVGYIPMERLENWARSNEGFLSVISNAEMMKEAFAQWKKMVAEFGVPEEEIGYIEKDMFEEIMQTHITVIFARAAVEQYFSCKTYEEIMNDTISNEEWVKRTVHEAIEMAADSMLKISVTFNAQSKMLKLLDLIFGAEHTDGESDHGDSAQSESGCVRPPYSSDF